MPSWKSVCEGCEKSFGVIYKEFVDFTPHFSMYVKVFVIE